jgi:hypothetical protein
MNTRAQLICAHSTPLYMLLLLVGLFLLPGWLPPPSPDQSAEQLAGNVSLKLQLPVSQPTCVTFEGLELGHLFITSAREGLSEAALIPQPNAGNMFIFKTPVKGWRAATFPFRRL